VQVGLPAELTCSGGKLGFVRWATRQSSRAAAWPCCPVAASNKAKNAVSAVQATSGAPGQVARGSRPPSDSESQLCRQGRQQQLSARLGEWRSKKVRADPAGRHTLVTGLAGLIDRPAHHRRSLPGWVPGGALAVVGAGNDARTLAYRTAPAGGRVPAPPASQQVIASAVTGPTPYTRAARSFAPARCRAAPAVGAAARVAGLLGR
jgi:hypothetical protein